MEAFHCRTFTILVAASSRNRSRSKWSDASLTSELRDFLAANRWPPSKVPTTKELSSYGRQDLANVVRRRGYKAVAQLLSVECETPSQNGSAMLGPAAEPVSVAESVLASSISVLQARDDGMQEITSEVNGLPVAAGVQVPENPRQLQENELAALTRELNEAKAHLALVQARSMAELSQIKQTALEKGIRLAAAEHALASLKQTDVKWRGVASQVELAGSFNGWQHFIQLSRADDDDDDDASESRLPPTWEVDLWLYPGVYEIKFIVDGEWQLDLTKEVAMKNMHQNNILRVPSEITVDS